MPASAAAEFLRLILADPDADGPRLVYADWLENCGEPARAEFIRLQCAASVLPADDPRLDALRGRADVLLEQNRLAWGEPLAGIATRWDWRRGFPEIVRMEARLFLARGDEMLAAVPVRHVELLDVTSHLAALARCPLLERLAGLTVAACPAGNAVARLLSRSPHVGRLFALQLPRNGFTDDAAAALASSPHLARLRTLDLSENAIGPAGAHTLAAARQFSGLTTLRLRDNPLGSDGVAAILTSTRMPRLTTLDLAQTGGLAASLSGPPGSDRLVALDLSANDLGDPGVELLAGRPEFAGLRDLDLSRTGVGDAGAAALAESPHLTGLRRLALNGNRITELGKRRLLAAPHFQNLPALELRGNWQ
jgi:uncharacterized protein (TIGR02996 family)